MPIILSTPVAAPVQAEPPVVIVYGDQVITPNVIDGFESTRATANIVHEVLGSASPDVSLRPARLRTGTLRMVFASELESADAELLHATATKPFQIMADTRTTLQMSYVPAGSISRALDGETRDVWILSVNFQEVDE